MPCCGGANYFLYDETLVGHDLANPPSMEEHLATIGDSKRATDAHTEYCAAVNTYLHELLPRYREEGGGAPEDEKSAFERYLSRDCLAVLTIGATGWSPPPEGNSTWRCTYADLTPAGKRLYKAVERLYAPNGALYLVTFVDT